MAAGAFVCATVGLGADGASKQNAELLKQKVATISAHGERPTKEGRRTTVTEGEVNSYLVYDAKPQLPAGVVDPAVTILGGGTGRLAGRAVVDLDAVRHSRASQSWFDPTNYLTGRLPVTASGILITKDGKGQFQLESAEISGVKVPKTVLQELLSYYSKTPENPEGINMDAPFELPAKIREIRVSTGTSTVVQ